MMSPTVLRNLTLLNSPLTGLPPHLAAASGLVRSGNWLHVIADDTLHMATFAIGEGDCEKPGQLHQLFPDPALPQDDKQRKKLKPDLESLALVPYQGGKALLALGSGSSARRQRGILQRLFPCGEVDGSPVIFDLRPLYAHLPFQELNIEGLALLGSRLYLGQRGNSEEGLNALIRLDLERALESIDRQGSWSGELLREVIPLDLGCLRGVPLSLTDLTALDEGRLLFAAAAEDTPNPYEDGQVLGSVLGTYSLGDAVTSHRVLKGTWKVEGVEASPTAEGFEILMVTDADDPLKPAVLLKTEWPAIP